MRRSDLCAWEAAEVGLSGTQKRQRALKEISEAIDDAIDFGDGGVGRMLEMVDGIVILLIATALLEAALAGVRAAKSAPVSG